MYKNISEIEFYANQLVEQIIEPLNANHVKDFNNKADNAWINGNCLEYFIFYSAASNIKSKLKI